MTENKLPISVHCIVKNGEPRIYEALKAVDWCDQKILVDDGSTDATVEIAEELGWEIHHYNGPDSMCERRNFLIGYKDGHQWWEGKLDPIKFNNEWTLQIDHDEVFADDAYEYFKKWLDGDKEHNVYSIMLNNMYTAGPRKGNVQSEIPLPRLFKVGTVHWEFDIQNDIKYEGDTGFVNTIMRHYGYGSWADHWKKQWARLTSNEERLAEDPKNLQSRVYLINCMSVLGERDVINFERSLANVSTALELSSKAIKHDTHTKMIVQRMLRHFFTMCLNNNKDYAMSVLLNTVESHIDWISDVSYWRLEMELRKPDIDVDMADQYARKYFKLMKEYRTPSVMNVEIQATEEEPRLATALREMFLFKLGDDLNIRASKKQQNDTAKKAEYWRKQAIIFDFYKELWAVGGSTYQIENLKNDVKYSCAVRIQYGSDQERTDAKKELGEI